MFLRRTNIVLFVDEGPVLPVQCFVTSFLPVQCFVTSFLPVQCFVTSFLPVQCEGEFLYESLVVEVELIDLKIWEKTWDVRCPIINDVTQIWKFSHSPPFLSCTHSFCPGVAKSPPIPLTPNVTLFVVSSLSDPVVVLGYIFCL